MAENKKKIRFGWAMSSVEPEKIGMTVKGVLGALVTILLVVAPYLGIDLSGIDFNSLIRGVYEAIISAGAVVSALTIAYGVVRKAIVAIKNRV